jgi:tRNA pseudouridine55 synthase
VELPVPRYSAVKIAGEPLHKRVRRGEQVTPPHRTMHVHSLALQRVYRDEDALIADVVMDVASGVYVRSIAEAIGEHLGYPACVSELRRTRIGSYRVEDAYTLEQVAQHTQRTNE